MKNIGSTFLIFGIGSIALNFFGYEFVLLSWVDNWGETIGWALRGAVIVAGGGLFFMGGRTGQGSSPEAARAQRQEPTMQASAPAPEPAPRPADAESGSDPMGPLNNS